MQLDRLELVMVRVVIALPWQVGEAMLGPSLTHPAVRVLLQLKSSRVLDNSSLHIVLHACKDASLGDR